MPPQPRKTRYTLLTEHQKAGEQKPTLRRSRFEHFEEAAEAARRMTPDHDGSVIPNIDQAHIDRYEKRGAEYSKGVYWQGNRYGAIIDHTPHEPTVYPD